MTAIALFHKTRNDEWLRNDVNIITAGQPLLSEHVLLLSTTTLFGALSSYPSRETPFAMDGVDVRSSRGPRL